MRVNVQDFLNQWTGSFRIEDKNESVYCDFRELLTDELKVKEIVDIKLERTMWTDENGEIVIII